MRLFYLLTEVSVVLNLCMRVCVHVCNDCVRVSGVCVFD